MTPADPTWADGFVAGAGLGVILTTLVALWIAKILALPGRDPGSAAQPNGENID